MNRNTVNIGKAISKEATQLIYSNHNITIEKCELYSDFTQSLYMLVFETYLGDDVTDLHEQLNHFKWCWDKTRVVFEKECLFFDNLDLYDYFLEFMLEVFYTAINKDEETILKIWVELFDYNRPKTNSDIHILTEIYDLMEKSLKKCV